MEDNNTKNSKPPKQSSPLAYPVKISFGDWDKDDGQIGGIVYIQKTKDESQISNYVLYWGKDDNTIVGDAIVSLSKTEENLTYTLPYDTIPLSEATKILVFVETIKHELLFSGSVFLSDISCQRVSDINIGNAESFYGSEEFTIFQDKLIFTAHNNIYGTELFSFDGVSSPTLIADIFSGSNSSYPENFYEFNGKLYFNNDFSKVYVYDGINFPSFAFTDADLYLGSGGEKTLCTYHNKLYFYGRGSGAGSELWVYDGVNAPTIVKDLNIGSGDSDIRFLTVNDNKLCFLANDGTGNKIWEYSDDINKLVSLNDTNVSYSQPYFLTSYNNKLYFIAYDDTNGNQLWRYDEVNKAVRLTKIGSKQSDGIEPYIKYVVHNNKFYFSAVVNGSENIWSYDPADDNVEQITFRTFGSWNAYNLTSFNGKLYFTGAYSFSLVAELFSYDDQSKQINMYRLNLGPDNSAAPNGFIIYKDKLYFSANCDDAYGKELYCFTEKSF
jgi:ELWxxDGT repeat protein